MRALTRLAAVAAAGTLAALIATTGPAGATSKVPTAGNGTTYSTPYVTAVKSLKVSGEVSSVRTHEVQALDDADHDCRDTRAEVLRAASRKATTGTCTVKTGRWVSSYDAVVVINARQIDIDHLVPLAEAWESGARSWTAARREAFANDLADPRAERCHRSCQPVQR